MTLKSSRTRNLRAVHESPAAKVAGFSVRLDVIVERYQTLIAASSRGKTGLFSTGDIATVARVCRDRTLGEYGRDTMVRQLAKAGHADLAEQVRKSTFAALAFVIEEADDLEARLILGEESPARRAHS